MTTLRFALTAVALGLALPAWTFGQSTGGTRTTSGSTTSGATSSASQATSSLGGGTGASAAGGGGGPGGTGSGGVQGPQFTQFGQAGAQVGNTFVGRGNSGQGFVGAAGAGQQSVDAGGTARFSGLGGGGGNRGGGQATTSQTRGSQMRVSQRISFPIPTVAAPVVTGNVTTYLTKTPQIGGGVTVVADDVGHVLLQGTVPDEHARKLAEALARLEPGVRRITNDLQVEATSSPPAAPSLGR